MNGPLHRFFAADHRRLGALLSRSVSVPGQVDLVPFGEFRAGILKHIGMEEKVLFPAARRRARPPWPSPPACAWTTARSRRCWCPHRRRRSWRRSCPSSARTIAAKRSPAGIYDACDEAVGPAEAERLVEQLRSFPGGASEGLQRRAGRPGPHPGDRPVVAPAVGDRERHLAASLPLWARRNCGAARGGAQFVRRAVCPNHASPLLTTLNAWRTSCVVECYHAFAMPNRDDAERMKASYEDRVRALTDTVVQRERELAILAAVASRVHGENEVAGHPGDRARRDPRAHGPRDGLDLHRHGRGAEAQPRRLARRRRSATWRRSARKGWANASAPRSSGAGTACRRGTPRSARACPTSWQG